jgi:hypothetical protein
MRFICSVSRIWETGYSPKRVRVRTGLEQMTSPLELPGNTGQIRDSTGTQFAFIVVLIRQLNEAAPVGL